MTMYLNLFSRLRLHVFDRDTKHAKIDNCYVDLDLDCAQLGEGKILLTSLAA